jgi:hypothetical protein
VPLKHPARMKHASSLLWLRMKAVTPTSGLYLSALGDGFLLSNRAHRAPGLGPVCHSIARNHLQDQRIICKGYAP